MPATLERPPSNDDYIFSSLKEESSRIPLDELYGPPGLAKKFGSGFALERPGLINNIINGRGFASDTAGNSMNGDNLGTGNNGWQLVNPTDL